MCFNCAQKVAALYNSFVCHIYIRIIWYDTKINKFIRIFCVLLESSSASFLIPCISLFLLFNFLQVILRQYLNIRWPAMIWFIEWQWLEIVVNILLWCLTKLFQTTNHSFSCISWLRCLIRRCNQSFIYLHQHVAINTVWCCHYLLLLTSEFS